MKSRLRNEEKESIHKNFQSHILYQLLYNPGLRFASDLKFRLSPEELFVECFDIIDTIKEKNREDANYYIRGLWDKKFCDLRDIKKDEESEEDVKKAVAVIIFGAAFCLNLSNKPQYTEFAASAIKNLINWSEFDSKKDTFEHDFCENYYEMDSVKAQKAFEEYMDSDNFITDEIYELLNHSILEIGDGTNPMIHHRFSLCKPSVTNARAQEEAEEQMVVEQPIKEEQQEKAVFVHEETSILPQKREKFRYIKSNDPQEVETIEETIAIYVKNNQPAELCKYLFNNESLLFLKMPAKSVPIFDEIVRIWPNENKISNKSLRQAWNREKNK